MTPQSCRGDPPACTLFKAPTAGRIPLDTSFPATRGEGTDADVSTQPASHASLRQRSKELRPRSSVSGSASKLKFFFSSESRLRIESDTPDFVFSLFLWPKKASAATLRLASQRQQRGQPIRAVARTAHQHRTDPWSPRQPTRKQPHSSSLPQTRRRVPQPAAPKRSSRWPAAGRKQARALALGPRSFRRGSQQT